MRKYFFVIALVFVGIVSVLAFVNAGPGVGVGLGKIRVDQVMKPGGIYKIADMPVFNTGSEYSKYKVSIAHHRDQTELRPLQEWFTLEPNEFYLDPNDVQLVSIMISLPVKGVEPGDYFAFVEAQPIPEEEFGGTSIGIAAASQLWFTVGAASFFQAVYYKARFTIIRAWEFSTPWVWILIALIVLAIIVSVLRKFINFEIKKR